MVVAPKPGGKIRTCVDFSRLNKFVKREYHKIHSVEENLVKLAGKVYFSKLDADSGFLQVPLVDNFPDAIRSILLQKAPHKTSLVRRKYLKQE